MRISSLIKAAEIAITSDSAAGNAASSLVRATLFVLLSLTPLVARAEEQDLGEAVHAIFVVGIFALMFFVGLSAGIWLLIVRLREENRQKAESGSNRPNLESIWFPGKNAIGSQPAVTPVPHDNP